MDKIEILRYNPLMIAEWEEFVAASRNATFLFSRSYMDYHSSRFTDHSLMARRGGRLIAILPANEAVDDMGLRILHSHGGLTYGGWLLAPRHSDAGDMLEIFEALGRYAIANGIAELDYKPLPTIYASAPSQEDRYALFRIGAQLSECNISCAIRLDSNPGFNTQQKRNLKRALKLDGLRIEEMRDVAPFHSLLRKCLAERHGASPVHSLSELQMLADRFSTNIRIFTLSDEEGMQAGVCVYDTGRVAHCQYICSTAIGRERGLLTLLFGHLINDIFAAREYFDFGTSNESHGAVLNEGLYRQKSGLGGSGVAYERYKLRFRSWAEARSLPQKLAPEGEFGIGLLENIGI